MTYCAIWQMIWLALAAVILVFDPSHKEAFWVALIVSSVWGAAGRICRELGR